MMLFDNIEKEIVTNMANLISFSGRIIRLKYQERSIGIIQLHISKQLDSLTLFCGKDAEILLREPKGQMYMKLVEQIHRIIIHGTITTWGKKRHLVEFSRPWRILVMRVSHSHRFRTGRDIRVHQVLSPLILQIRKLRPRKVK